MFFSMDLNITSQPHKSKKPFNFMTLITTLKNLVFTWDSPLEFKYLITLSADEKTWTKKLTMGQTTGYRF